MRKKAYIIGAGPSAELITAEGLAILKRADVIISDRLLDEKLLLEARDDAILVPVGKRYHRHLKSQEEINSLLVEYANAHPLVVRLKGGDPFVFGRGGEEVAALMEAGIDAEVIPGVSTAVAAAEILGIPVTHRGSASSFTVVTGHGAQETAEDFSDLVRLKGTLVFMMAWHKITDIAEGLMAAGKPADTPCAIVSRAKRPGQKRVTDELGNICNRIGETTSPAVFIVGDVARLDFSSKDKGRLCGKNYLVAGTKGFVRKMCGMLTDAGAHGTPLVSLVVRAHAENIPEDFSDVGWLVFTSANGVKIFFDELASRRMDVRSLAHVKVACIGEATAEELAGLGVFADLVPGQYTSKALGEALIDVYKAADGKVLMLRAAEASPVLGQMLREHGIDCEERAIYSLERETIIPELREYPFDAIIFASAGGVRAFYEMLNDAGEWDAVSDVQTVCIGESTASAWTKMTGKEPIVAAVSTAEGIMETLVQ
ncbi:MAG: uroporphyrinogen-III C-methyltransferase [Lachnospiraceae bacterium]|nr:uroporphyrinogen-III C-methyltransferase [Lachnospiraceae bacterium]